MREEFQVSNINFYRSVNIELDQNNPDVLKSFISNATADKVIEETLFAIRSGQGAITWTGSYGSGKSTLAMVLQSLLGDKRSNANKLASSCISKSNTELIESLSQLKQKTVCINVIASDSKLEERVRAEAANILGEDEKGLTTSEFLLKKSEKQPVIIFIDELGKFFETCAKESSDIFFMQQIAEAAVRSDGRLIVIGLLHQGFSQYASNLEEVTQSEWAKVQGRFADIPFNISIEEQIHLLHKFLVNKKKGWDNYDPHGSFKTFFSNYSKFEPWANKKILSELFPLCPITAILLCSISKKSFAQNQRTLFSFLQSNEPLSFLRTISEDGKKTFGVSNLWDYLEVNFENSILRSTDQYDWILARECLQKTKNLDDHICEQIIKCISMIQIFGKSVGLKPSKQNIFGSLPQIPKKDLEKTLSKLLLQKVIIYRETGAYYSLADTSDFDLEAALKATPAQDILSDIKLAKVIHGKRHYIETGNLRWMNISFANLDNLTEALEQQSTEYGNIYICLSRKNSLKAKKTIKEIVSNTDLPVAVVFPNDPISLTKKIEQKSKIDLLQNQSEELRYDKIARSQVFAKGQELFNEIISSIPDVLLNGEWIVSKPNSKSTNTWSDIKSVQNSAHINQKISELFDIFYNKAPPVKNELVNRTKLSGNATAALKGLMLRCITHEHIEQLGIEKTPPELTIYNSVIKEFGLHNNIDNSGTFKISIDTSKRISKPITEMWEAIEITARKKGDERLLADEIFEIWSRPPFGLKKGIFPLFLLLFILTNRHQLAIYSEGIYLTDISTVVVDWLIKSPNDFSFSYVDFSKSQNALTLVAEDLSIFVNRAVEPTPLDVGRALKQILNKLPKWSLNTRLMSSNTLAVRDEIKKAHDPIDLVNLKLPQLVGENYEGLKSVLLEITDAFNQQTINLKDQLLEEFRLTHSQESFQEINTRALAMKKKTGDFDLESFITQLETFDGTIECSEELFLNLIRKDPKQMIDTDIDRAKISLSERVNSFENAEAMVKLGKRTSKNTRSLSVIYGPAEKREPISLDVKLNKPELKLAQQKATEISNVLDSLAPVDENIAIGAITIFLERKLSEK